VRKSAADSTHDPPSSRSFAANRKSASLIVGQSKSSASELLLQDTVLFSVIFDDFILMAADPTGHVGNKDLSRLEYGGHRLIVARQRNIRQLSLSLSLSLSL